MFMFIFAFNPQEQEIRQYQTEGLANMTSKAMRAAATAAAADDSMGDGDSSRPPMPNQAESYLFYTMHLAMKSKPDFDWNAVADMNGFKNAETAYLGLSKPCNTAIPSVPAR
ncbi:hypothetical protein B0T24DRAFT_685227 [Lasiosphaeria ovina]|uniref:Uncharacterized protein n=1 Tax=Lasiosphaeria ovina TaxID=92902 RepID=A0AAE0JTH4_9PEZI|nr:hypothetical protein B0T24DRAFT_685227 [Lasiosphaeria ovina]